MDIISMPCVHIQNCQRINKKTFEKIKEEMKSINWKKGREETGRKEEV